MPRLKKTTDSPTWLRLGMIAALLSACGIVIFQLRDIAASLLTAFCLAYILNPAVDWLERHQVRRAIAVGLLLSLVVLLILLGLLFMGPLLLDQLADFIGIMPRKLHNLYEKLDGFILNHFHYQLPQTDEEVLMHLRYWVEENQAAWLKPVGTFIQSTFNNTIEVILFILNLLLLPMFTIYLLIDFHQIAASIKNLVPRSLISKVENYLNDFDTILASFFRGQLLLILVMAIYYSCGFLLVGVPMAIFVGIISGLGHLAPYLGPTLSLLTGLILILADYHSFTQLLGFFSIILLAQLLESFMLTPRLVGKRLGLPPLATILALLVFGKLLGFLGMLLAVPLAAISKIALAELKTSYHASAFYQRR